jgi:hypothetical protein
MAKGAVTAALALVVVQTQAVTDGNVLELVVA